MLVVTVLLSFTLHDSEEIITQGQYVKQKRALVEALTISYESSYCRWLQDVLFVSMRNETALTSELSFLRFQLHASLTLKVNIEVGVKNFCRLSRIRPTGSWDRIR